MKEFKTCIAFIQTNLQNEKNTHYYLSVFNG